MTRFEAQLRDALFEKSVLDKAAFEKLTTDAKQKNVSWISCLIDNGMMKEEDLLSLMSALLDLPFINLKNVEIDPSVVRSVPIRFAWYYECMPIALEGNTLRVAVNLPLSIRVQDEMRLSLGHEISMVLAKKEQILELLKTYYGLGADTVDKMIMKEGEAEGGKSSAVTSRPVEDIQDIEKLAEDASVVKLVNQIIFEAYKRRATDIHIEPFRGSLRLRYRIDGVLQDQKVPKELDMFLMPILSRIKIMSNLDIVERRVPQDGRAIVKTQDEVLDLRVSFIPTPHGESVVIRILPTKMFLSLEKLGLSKRNRELFQTLIKKPSGIIFVTGPTGSGKSTTLYACLQRVDKSKKKIITIEDPVEYEMDGVTQIQVNPEVGLTFAQGLRSVLRHDPDIMMVGEVRDKETAEIAIRVALTGHLVLSTLHTNDAATGVTRLVDIGLEPYLVASSVEAFIAQRLVRVLCPACKARCEKNGEDIKKEMGRYIGNRSDCVIFEPRGCEKCSFTGFYGRTAIYEMLLVDDHIKDLVIRKATAAEVKRRAVQNGMRTLLQDGVEKVAAGITTLEEVLNVCQEVSGKDPEKSVRSPARTTDTERRNLPEEESLGRNRRIYMRVPRRIPLRFRIIEKGEGDIIKLEDNIPGEGTESIFSEVLSKSFPEKDDADAYKNVITTTINLSAGGLVFESKYQLPVHSVIEMMLDLPDGDKPVRCLAKIVRTEKDLPRCFYSAVCYLDISGVERTRIDRYVQGEIVKQKLLNMEEGNGDENIPV